MNERLEEIRRKKLERQNFYKESLTYTFVQSEAKAVSVDFSVSGDSQDFAIRMHEHDPGNSQEFMSALWTGESAIFAAVTAFWLNNSSNKQRRYNRISIDTSLRELENKGFTPSNEGQLREIHDYLIQDAIDSSGVRLKLPMNAYNDDTLMVDTTNSEHMVVSAERKIDGKVHVAKFSVLPEQSWEFVAGMIGRSYYDGISSRSLSRINTELYIDALNKAVAYRAGKLSQHMAERATNN